MQIQVNGKTYNAVDANTVFKKNTDEELENHFNGKDSIDAKWTRHIKQINQMLKDAPPYKAGRPSKASQKEEISYEPEA